MYERKDTVWQRPDVAKNFLRARRGAIPGAADQIRVMLSVLGSIGRPVQSFLDLGCGGGTLGASILESFPEARGVFVDFSEDMLSEARTLLEDSTNCHFLSIDYSPPGWVDEVSEFGPYDAIVSGFSIHHQTDERKREVYKEIFDLLLSGGVFVNIEHVSPSTKIGRELFDNQFIDSLYALEREQGGPRSREQIAHDYHTRADKEANILAPIDAQCQWLTDIGFLDVDCHMKIYELAVLAGRKP